MRLSPYALAAAIVSATAMVHAPQAQASQVASNAVGACQASLPLHDASLRKRPLGIRNEGSSNVFISCGVQWGFVAYSNDLDFVLATNQNAKPVDLTCTLVSGPYPGLAAYMPKTVTLPAHSTGVVDWTETFNTYFNVSCNVPPGVEINVVGAKFTTWS
jgi:hypothetical protein